MKLDTRTYDLLKQILGDAHLIDIDLSMWDKYLSIIVIADHFESRYSSKRRALFKLKFDLVSHFSCNFFHLKEKSDEQDRYIHYQWLIDKSSIKQNGNELEIIMECTSELLPSLLIICENIEIEEIDPKILDTINPKWTDPSGPLVRLDVNSIYSMMKRK
ncbi:hypothetical protein ACFQ21_18520 [Ohtaekwangia kribbensis]|uniref:IPExxxVDY family protein n=1 Tax=Ohtaekwangia kribbensis TaxID=688913 RepID=A0ABW3K695_9BACT